MPDDILDDLFHGCAVKAYIETAIRCGNTPCPTETRHLAYQLYEEALAERNMTQPVPSTDNDPHNLGKQ